MADFSFNMLHYIRWCHKNADIDEEDICTECNGIGIIICRFCDDDGSRCTECFGRGSWTCTACSGDGSRTRQLFNKHRRREAIAWEQLAGAESGRVVT